VEGPHTVSGKGFSYHLLGCLSYFCHGFVACLITPARYSTTHMAVHIVYGHLMGILPSPRGRSGRGTDGDAQGREPIVGNNLHGKRQALCQVLVTV
jgi:hypothetical protein